MCFMVVPKKAPHVSLVAYDQMGVQSTVPSFGTPDILSISAALILMWPLGIDDTAITDICIIADPLAVY